jgi:phage terminase Nu1 subunit (DNA packaging protein)
MYNKINQIQLGHALAKDRKTISRWTKAGMPRNDDKTYDLPACIAWIVEREREAILADQAMAASNDSPALERYRQARAEMSELDLQVKKGALISIAEVHEGWAWRMGEVKQGLLFLAERFSSTLPGQSSERVRSIVNVEVRSLLDNFCRVGKFCHPDQTGDVTND